MEYDQFMIQHVRKCDHFTIGQKLKLVHQLGIDLEKTDTKLRNRHECECCGITIDISNRIGPECAKHPDKFPCNTHRSNSQLSQLCSAGLLITAARDCTENHQ